MVEELARDVRELKEELLGLRGNYVVNLDIDISDVKKKLEDEMKRDMAGRSSYGVGV